MVSKTMHGICSSVIHTTFATVNYYKEYAISKEGAKKKATAVAVLFSYFMNVITVNSCVTAVPHVRRSIHITAYCSALRMTIEGRGSVYEEFVVRFITYKIAPLSQSRYTIYGEIVERL